MLESLLNKVAGLQACNFTKKETPTQVFFCEYCEVFKNTHSEEQFFYRALPLAASVYYPKMTAFSSHGMHVRIELVVN